MPPEEPRVLRFGKMVSGTVRNAVSGKTVLEGSLRTYREEVHILLRQGLEALGRAIETETGCAVQVHLSEGYPAVWNDEGLYAALRAALGPDAIRNGSPASFSSWVWEMRRSFTRRNFALTTRPSCPGAWNF